MSPVSRWLMGIVVIASLLTFIPAIWTSPPATITLHNVKVDVSVGHFDYWLITEDGTRIYAMFCPDEPEPPWNDGEILDVLQFHDLGKCWSMTGVHPRWINRRDKYGNEVHWK
jgi:hypothetical protein